MREAEESGQRQREERLRRTHDELFKQVREGEKVEGGEGRGRGNEGGREGGEMERGTKRGREEREQGGKREREGKRG